MKMCVRECVCEREREAGRREVLGLCMSKGLVSVLIGERLSDEERPEASLNSSILTF